MFHVEHFLFYICFLCLLFNIYYLFEASSLYLFAYVINLFNKLFKITPNFHYSCLLSKCSMTITKILFNDKSMDKNLILLKFINLKMFHVKHLILVFILN